ncbi:MAG: DUF401 family protein [Thermodesulfobacteriota bacterium]
MSLLHASLPLLKVALAFVLMLAGIRFRLGLWQSILAGSLALGLLFGLPLAGWLAAAAAGVTSDKALLLGSLVGLIMVLSECMEKTGQAGRLMEALSGFLRSPRLRLVFFPALIGLLPMPGGAVFSAPMLKGASAHMDLDDRERVLLNYWFRHVWEMSWPLYPGILLASSLSGYPLSALVGALMPGALLFMALGWIFYLRPGVLNLSRLGPPPPPPPAGAGRLALREGLPLLLATGGSMAVEGVLALAGPGLPFEAGVILGLGAAILACALQNRKAAGRALSSLNFRHLATMVLVVAAIFAFKEVLARAGVVEELSRLAGGAAALFACAVFLPLAMGFVSGITVAYVGSAFPLLLGLLDQAGLREAALPYLVLGMFSGLTGIMASPIHICFILTCQYFRVPLGAAWPRLALPCALFLAGGAAYFFILR